MKIPFLNRPATVSVLRLQGAIGMSSRGGGGLSDAGLASVLERAFKRRKPVAVALAINSPGGSPVQSSLIGSRIRRLSEEHDVPVHAFVEDVAASGGYWLASSADFIWADESSVLGSIGVIAAGFGFSDLIGRHGIERRVHTAGQSKSMLDPFRPEKPEDVERLKKLLEPIHEAFKNQIRARRGNRLPADRDLFTGEIWTGRQAVELGLADGLAHLVPKMRELYGKDIRFQTYGQKTPLLRRFGLSADDVMDSLQERAAFSRFGTGG
ncbi:S49 family peptidase [Paracoccus laeviglucosivorans]|uniref:Serine protease SohB n=1 Tax=Paracoccus laeviglucosivorans TaxID=1197861 RepID=A0A521FGP5_9RHOB|nr:S49 family peptidase [Paracoccus laeviglucosivorans]SMO95342.1 serine protease SohB [Paracoccus laeviglucosivorans]